MKTIWFYQQHVPRVRRIWAGIYGSDRVRRAQWLRALRIAVETVDAVAPMIEDKDTSLFVRQQLDQLAAEVESWSAR